MKTELEATHLRGHDYAVRPKDQLGTCGSWPFLWTVQYVSARSAEKAIELATPYYEQRERQSKV